MPRRGAHPSRGPAHASYPPGANPTSAATGDLGKPNTGGFQPPPGLYYFPITVNLSETQFAGGGAPIVAVEGFAGGS